MKRERLDQGLPPKGGAGTVPTGKPPVGASLRDQLAIRFMDQLMAPMYARGISPGITAQMAKGYADHLIAVLKDEEGHDGN